ncbi:MAG TPA: IS481 family transposase [Solirubrobacteraceae bacterium]|jgi:transposase InsO family protein|nr:IS481 family transposase [Solirubrobacteraceae bacterium]
MGLARYVVDAVLLEGRSAREVAAAHGISKSWIYVLIKRYRAGGYEALEPRSRRPRSCEHETPVEVVQAIVALRRELQADGHDAGAATIAYHLAKRVQRIPSRTTIWRILKREGLIVPQPQKRPRCSLIRFEADLPNETWQTDITHWQLAGGEHAEILNFIDDHSRLFLASDAYPTTKAQDVVDSFHKAASLHGLPASLLSDNGAVFTASPRRGKVLLQSELERLGIASKNSRPYHPQTCGKIERLHQTLKRYLAKQSPANSLPQLQGQLDTFVHYYNDIRPHRALDGRTPLQAYSTRIKAKPNGVSQAPTHFRVRQDKVDQAGKVSLRYHSKLYKIGLGRAHKGRTIKLLIADQQIRVIDLQGQLIRELTLDPTRNYQPLTQP